MRRFTLSLPAAPSDAKALSLFLYRVKRIPLDHLFVTCLTVSISIDLQNTSLPHFAGHPFLCKIGLTLDCGEIRLFLNCSTLFPSYFDSQMAIWEHWYLSLPIHEISAGNVTDFGSLGRQIFHPLLKKKVIWQTDKTVGGLACNQQSVVLQSLRGLQIP